MAVHDGDVERLTFLLSKERLAALTTLTGSPKRAIELHQETLQVGGALMCVIACVEITLRNSICENLAKHFGTDDWLTTPPPPFSWRQREQDMVTRGLDSARRAEYAKLSQSEKHALDAIAFPNGLPENLSHLGRAKARRAKIDVTPGKTIAELTFYIWKRLCGPDYEHTLWRPTLKRVFPDKKVKRATVAEHLEVLYQARNRLAHHEPVLHNRFTDTMQSVEFIAQNLEAASLGDQNPLARLIAEDVAQATSAAEALHARLDSYR